jgi:hypothetical protein
MVAQRPVPEIGGDLLRLVEPLVDAEIILDGPAPFFTLESAW